MNAASDVAGAEARPRGPATWYSYLLLGVMTYLVSVQGNILPFLQGELSLSYRAVSLHTSAIAVGIILDGLFGDRVVRRVGRRPMMIVAGLGSAVAAVLLTLAPTAAASIGACFLIGLFGAFIGVMVTAILSDIHGERRDIAYAEANAMSYVFAIMAPALSALAAALGLGWRPAILAGAAAAVVIVAAFFRTPLPPSRETAAASAAPLAPAYWCYFVVLGLSVAVEFSMILWTPAYLERVIGLSPSAAAIGAAAFFVAMLAARIAGGPLFRLVSIRRLFPAAAVTTLAGFALYWSAATGTVAIAGLFAVGLGVALLFPLAQSFAIEAAGEAADRASARLMLAPGIAILVNPPLLGAIADTAGLRYAQLMTPVFMAVAALAFLAGELARRRRTR